MAAFPRIYHINRKTGEYVKKDEQYYLENIAFLEGLLKEAQAKKAAAEKELKNAEALVKVRETQLADERAKYRAQKNQKVSIDKK